MLLLLKVLFWTHNQVFNFGSPRPKEEVLNVFLT